MRNITSSNDWVPDDRIYPGRASSSPSSSSPSASSSCNRFNTWATAHGRGNNAEAFGVPDGVFNHRSCIDISP